MGSATLELILNGPKQDKILPITAHVQKYTERFIYTDGIADTSTPIAYYESEELDSWKNVQMIDTSHTIAANVYNHISTEVGWTEIYSSSITSRYKSLAITNILGKDKFGKRRPIFFKHDLPDYTIEASLNVVTNGAVKDLVSGYIVDIEEEDIDVIYTNFQNYYNPDTGAYRLYYVSSVQEDPDSSEVSTSHEMLNPVPVAQEATWEDIILEGEDYGKVTESYPLYTVEENSSGYTFYMNTGGTWYIKPIESSTIKPMMPFGRDPEDGWYIRFTDGSFTSVVNGALRHYYLPEYDRQSFSPYKPYIYSPYRKMLWVNRATIAATRSSLAIDPTQGMHFQLFILDENDELIRILTTDSTIDGDRWSDTEILIEGDVISSWDNKGGFVSLGVEIDPNWNFYATYYYEANDYEYTGVTLNPLQNKRALDYMWVYYMVPDADDDDKAIHVLGVDKGGTIVYASQEKGRTYPNFQLTESDGTANPDTLIGTQYRSIDSTDTFIHNYTVNYSNTYGYYVLAEVLVMDIAIEEDSFVVDVRRDGNTIKEEYFEDAIRSNQRILQSRLGYGPDGQEFPQNTVMLIRAPITLLEEYGGVLSPDRAQNLLNSYIPQMGYGVIHWDYPVVDLTGNSLTSEQADLVMSWEGSGLTYNLYRKQNPVGEWELLDTIVDPTEGDVLYADAALNSGEIYYYGVRVVEGDNEFPFSNMLGVMVK